MLDSYFTRSFYKHILGISLSIHDFEDVDPEYYKSLKWIDEHGVTGLALNFSYSKNEFGNKIIIDLKKDGRNIPVTEETKKEYIDLICYFKMGKIIKSQLEAFLEGFHDLIPKTLISIFNERELELLISGLPDIDSTSSHKIITF